MKVWFGIERDRGMWPLLLLTALMAGLWALQPWIWGRVFDAAAAFRNRQTQQAQLANATRLVEEIRMVDPGQQALLDQAAVAFPFASAAPQIVERLEALADGQEVVVRLDSIREEQAANARKEQLVPLAIRLTVSGSPGSLLAFLEAVEHMQEFTQVDSWEMAAAPEVAGGVVYRLEMEVRFFLQPSV